ncbi:MAG: hypothetical protein NVSMB62_24920 [Acidobacteriaceae bacterium]
MRWVANVPANTIPCGEGVLEIQMSNADAATGVAKMGASAYVTAQVSGAVAEAIRTSPDLAQKLSPLPSPELVYALGQPVELPGPIWRIPFRAYAVPRVAAAK